MRRQRQNTYDSYKTDDHPMSDSHWLDCHFKACSWGYKRSLELAGFGPGMRVLDTGCGSGSYIPWIKSIVGETGTVVGIDPIESNIAIAKKRAPEGTRLDVGSAFEMPYEDN